MKYGFKIKLLYGCGLDKYRDSYFNMHLIWFSLGSFHEFLQLNLLWLFLPIDLLELNDIFFTLHVSYLHLFKVLLCRKCGQNWKKGVIFHAKTAEAQFKVVFYHEKSQYVCNCSVKLILGSYFETWYVVVVLTLYVKEWF